MAKQSSMSGELTPSVIASSDMVYDLYCEVCSEDGKHLEAAGYCVDCQDYLCSDCFKGHKSTRISRNHVLQDKTTMPQQKPSPSVAVPSTGSCTEKCAHHPDRLVEYYCRDDRSLGCSVCMTVNHRLCNSDDHIPELAEQLLDSQDYKQFTDTLNRLNTESQSVIKSTKENVIQAEKRFSDAENMLQELRKNITEAFDKFERDIKNKASAIKSADLKKMQDISDKGQAVFDEVKRISAEQQSLQGKNQLGQLFIHMMKLGDTMASLHTLLAEADADNSVTAYTLEPGSQVQEILDGPTSIGKLSVQATAMTNETVIVTDIGVRTKRDTKICRICASALLPGNKLILADSYNNKVKLLDLQVSEVTSDLNTASWPCDITSITADLVAVTLPDSSKIVFVKVSDKLKKVREMQVAGEVRSIIHNDGKLIVSFREPVKIVIMTMDGTVERKIGQPGLFEWPFHMAISLDCKTIYISDFENDCVKRITLEGTVEAEYRDKELLRPRGLTVDQHGRVIVCAEGSRNIHLLTPDLTKVKVLVDGLYKPHSLSYCHSTGMLFVCMNVSDIVKVYQLS